MKIKLLVLTVFCALFVACDEPEGWVANNNGVAKGEGVEKLDFWPHEIAGGWKVVTNYPTDGGMFQVIATVKDPKSGTIICARGLSGTEIPKDTEVRFKHLFYRVAAAAGPVDAVVVEKLPSASRVGH